MRENAHVSLNNSKHTTITTPHTSHAGSQCLHNLLRFRSVNHAVLTQSTLTLGILMAEQMPAISRSMLRLARRRYLETTLNSLMSLLLRHFTLRDQQSTETAHFKSDSALLYADKTQQTSFKPIHTNSTNFTQIQTHKHNQAAAKSQDR